MFINPFSIIGYMYSGILKWSSSHLGRLCTFEFMVCTIMSPECHIVLSFIVLSFHKDIAFSALRPGLTQQGKKEMARDLTGRQNLKTR
jgi:hypothetical protein